MFMLLGDVGGFSGLLYATSAVIVSYFSFYNVENYVAASLYQTQRRRSKHESGIEHQDLNPWKQLAVLEYLQECLPRCCLIGCMRRRKKDKHFVEARQRLMDEMDLVTLLRNMRFLQCVVDNLVVPEV